MARLETVEVVFRQYLQDREERPPDQAAWDQALEEATGASGGGAVSTPGAGGALLVPHRTEGMDLDALPPDYRKIMGIVAGRTEPVMAKEVAAALGRGSTPASVEPVRVGKLRKLAERGWLRATGSGRYLPGQK